MKTKKEINDEIVLEQITSMSEDAGLSRLLKAIEAGDYKALLAKGVSNAAFDAGLLSLGKNVPHVVLSVFTAIVIAVETEARYAAQFKTKCDKCQR